MIVDHGGGNNALAAFVVIGGHRGHVGLGIGPGSRVSWQLPTRAESVILSMGLARLGAIQNPVWADTYFDPKPFVEVASSLR